MSLVRWNPLREMDSLMGSVFGRLPVRAGNGGDVDWLPAVDVTEGNGEFLLKVELPGIDKENLSVTVEQGALTISGERRHEKTHEDEKVHRIERSYGRFVRTFTLPDNVDAGAIKADHTDGLLVLHLPKLEPSESKGIEVKIR